MTDNNCEIRAGRWESAQDIKMFHSGAGIRAEDWEMIKDWFQLRNWAAAPIQAQLWAWIFLPKSCFPRNPPILDPVQEILISIMISRGPWSNEGAAIDLENAQDRPVTGAPLLEMWHFVLFIHLERKKSGKYFKCWLQCQKMFFHQFGKFGYQRCF